MSIPRASNWKMKIVIELRGVGGGAPWKNIELLNRQASAIPPMPTSLRPRKGVSSRRRDGVGAPGQELENTEARSAGAWGRGMKPRDTAVPGLRPHSSRPGSDEPGLVRPWSPTSGCLDTRQVYVP